MVQKEEHIMRATGKQKEIPRELKGLLTRIPRPALATGLLIPLLLLIDALCYQVALPVEIDVQHNSGTLIVGSTHLALGQLAQPRSLQFAPHDPLIHEYQIDGSDSTNNLDLDTTYLSQIAGSPYYQLQAWMRNLDGTSRWRNLEIQANGHEIKSITWPGNGANISLPNATNMQIRLQFQRPETPMSLNLLLSDGRTLQITLDRNNRKVTVSEFAGARTIASAFFPVDAAPFAAMVVDTLARILLWAALLLLVVQFCEMGLGLIPHISMVIPSVLISLSQRLRAHLGHRIAHLFQALHPVAFIALGCSLIYVIWIALAVYRGQPHIYDASAYLFSAKMYASWQFSVPAPPTSELFPGPFMLIFHGRWFGQYEPGTALTLVPGIWLGVPWLIEPLLGTLALLGIGLIASRIYNRRVATLAVVLGCLSPFYSYLAASYLSHAIALFYLVWGFWALLRFVQGRGGWNMLICGCCFGMAALTRDLVALLYIAILIPGVMLITRQRKKEKQRRPKRPGWWLILLILGMIFFYLYLDYNLSLTGDALTTPRNLFFPGDTWGFGQGIGFYGQHTLAAGFVNLDELLTSLQIDLFGWPFYLTLAFIAIPFLTGRAQKTDWFLLLALILTVGSYVGYFYHGIYLGPRYLFEDLPFLLILSARGMLILGAWGREAGQAVTNWRSQKNGQVANETRPGVSLASLALISLLILCNLLYYLPRQATRYQNFTGLPLTTRLDTSQIYHSPIHHAIVVTDDLAIYQLVLFPLNDPTLTQDVIYAWGYTNAQLLTLRQDFPHRTLYLLVVNPDGSVRYTPFTQ